MFNQETVFLSAQYTAKHNENSLVFWLGFSVLSPFRHSSQWRNGKLQGGSNMTGTDYIYNKYKSVQVIFEPHCISIVVHCCVCLIRERMMILLLSGIWDLRPRITVNFMFCCPCISIYACNETNLMHCLSSVYSVTIPQRVLGLLDAHHQEVAMYI
jgi:hypothetical protein